MVFVVCGALRQLLAFDKCFKQSAYRYINIHILLLTIKMHYSTLSAIHMECVCASKRIV